MALNVSAEMTQKLADAGDQPIMDSLFLTFEDGRPEKTEKTQGTKGLYISSPVDGFLLHGPFDAAL